MAGTQTIRPQQFAASSMEQVWQHRACYAAAGWSPLSAAGHGAWDGAAIASGRWRDRPIAQAHRANHTGSALANDSDLLPKLKERTDAGFRTATGLEAVSVLRGV